MKPGMRLNLAVIDITIDTVFGLTIIGIAIVLGVFSLIPAWLAVQIGVAGWWFIGHAFWRYEAWKASGPRGIYWNPTGFSAPYGPTVHLVWWTFGVFISIAHSFCRRGWHNWVKRNLIFWRKV
jgi:hypothetical protein